MRTLVKRALLIPHGAILYIDRRPGQPAVLWLDETEFTAADAARIDRKLNGAGQGTAGESSG